MHHLWSHVLVLINIVHHYLEFWQNGPYWKVEPDSVHELCQKQKNEVENALGESFNEIAPM